VYLGVRASTGPKPLHVCSVGPVSTRHAVVSVFLGFAKITISPLMLDVSACDSTHHNRHEQVVSNRNTWKRARAVGLDLLLERSSKCSARVSKSEINIDSSKIYIYYGLPPVAS
jgi:hypothetical protein